MSKDYVITYIAIKEEEVTHYLGYEDNVNSRDDAIRYAERFKEEEMETGYRMEGNIADEINIMEVSEVEDE